MAYSSTRPPKITLLPSKEIFQLQKSFLTVQYLSHKTQLLFKITVGDKTEVFVFIDLGVESKKGKYRDSRGFPLEGKKRV